MPDDSTNPRNGITGNLMEDVQAVREDIVEHVDHILERVTTRVWEMGGTLGNPCQRCRAWSPTRLTMC